MEAVDTLVKYGTSYQSKVVASLLSDVKFLEQVNEITKPAFLNRKLISGLLMKFWIISTNFVQHPLWRFSKSKLVI